jgi:hypothetical protein
MSRILPANNKQYWIKYEDPSEDERTTTLWSIGPGEAMYSWYTLQPGRRLLGCWTNGINYDDLCQCFRAPYRPDTHNVNPLVQEELL